MFITTCIEKHCTGPLILKLCLRLGLSHACLLGIKVIVAYILVYIVKCHNIIDNV